MTVPAASANVRVDFALQRAAAPALFYRDLTLVATVGGVDSAKVTVDGAAVPSRYDPAAGTVTFTTAGSAVQLLISGHQGSAPIGVVAAALKDDARWAWSQSFDDNVYLQASIAVMRRQGWRGTLYLIGNILSDTRDEGWIVDAPQIVPLLNAGWSVGNHTENHACGEPEASDPAARAATIVADQTRLLKLIAASTRPEYRPIAFAAPCFADFYDQTVAQLRGQTGLLFNESQGNPLMIVSPGAAAYAADGQRAVPVAGTTVKIGRDTRIDDKPDDVIATMAWISKQAGPGRAFWYNSFLHGQREANLARVVARASQIDGLWVAPADEVYSYLVVRDTTVIGPLVVAP